jgi:hypothetical protein
LPAERLRSVNEQNIHVSSELKVLEAVVQYEHINAGFQFLALFIAIWTDAESWPLAQSKFHQFDFVARFAVPLVASTENAYSFAIGHKALGQPYHHGRLAGSADREVSHANHWPI